MSDAAFELRLERAARQIADEGVRPVDAVEIAQAAIRAVGRAAEIDRSRPEPRVAWLALAAVAIAIALAVVGSLVLSGRHPDVGASPSPSASPSTSPSPTPAPVGVPGGSPGDTTWLADVPADLTFDGAAATRMAFTVTAGPLASVDVVGGPAGLFHSSFVTVNVGEVRITSDRTDPVSVALDGNRLGPCGNGDEGSYQSESTRDGLILTLTLIRDACPSRAAILARSWTRSISVPNGGGIGVVDGLDPLFTVDMPAGTYAVDRSTDAVTIHQDLPELQLMSLKDPQGFVDPCDRSKGRYAIAPGADAVTSYFRQLAGLTVDSTTEVTVDGHRAIRLVMHADADVTCPDGRLWAWQPKAETGDLAWFTGAGITDSLTIVEHPKGTLMFEVLPSPNSLEEQVIGSIRFLDQLPTTP